MVKASSPADSGLATTASIITEMTDRPSPNPSASPGAIIPRGTGRLRVRCISASMSASHHMFRAPDAPAPQAMHSKLAIATTGCTEPGAATMPASAVNTTSDMTRGFSNSTKSPNCGSALRAAAGICAAEMSVTSPASGREPRRYSVAAASFVGASPF